MATIHLPPDFKEFLQLLNSHQIENQRKSEVMCVADIKDLTDLENLPEINYAQNLHQIWQPVERHDWTPLSRLYEVLFPEHP